MGEGNAELLRRQARQAAKLESKRNRERRLFESYRDINGRWLWAGSNPSLPSDPIATSFLADIPWYDGYHKTVPKSIWLSAIRESIGGSDIIRVPDAVRRFVFDLLANTVILERRLARIHSEMREMYRAPKSASLEVSEHLAALRQAQTETIIVYQDCTRAFTDLGDKKAFFLPRIPFESNNYGTRQYFESFRTDTRMFRLKKWWLLCKVIDQIRNLLFTDDGQLKYYHAICKRGGLFWEWNREAINGMEEEEIQRRLNEDCPIYNEMSSKYVKQMKEAGELFQFIWNARMPSVEDRLIMHCPEAAALWEEARIELEKTET
ncbi:hypothetical protein BJ508DRAFT_416714 [Ascobolus immersus RN42]|uniref:Uncharacterized protein n=1 Tax=Ascobolus immersus RN42 TaxID=1160509 RepID=A0A3N4I1J1_ASCIM|nr:hypothetical protein BJ508DRAFT_416714 [Ascobolus immersus RN42]